mmetsp:Transcript_38869/g.82920  ORF Transcript_38869/g.82920 Transcript_38869/m.82920 type:complete len:222 (+) Transcript_38869:44-709(+)
MFDPPVGRSLRRRRAAQRQRLSMPAIVLITVVSFLPAMAQAFMPPESMEERPKRQQKFVSTIASEERIAKTAIVLIDPVTDWKQATDAASDLNLVVVTVQMPDVALPEKFQPFLPTSQAFVNAGAAHTMSKHHRDVMSTAQQLQILAIEYHLRTAGFVVLSEVAVEVSDLIASCLGLTHNPLKLFTARSDKGSMKGEVKSEVLRVAHARFGTNKALHAARL